MKIVAIDHENKNAFFIDTRTVRTSIKYFPDARSVLTSGDVHHSFIPDIVVIEQHGVPGENLTFKSKSALSILNGEK